MSNIVEIDSAARAAIGLAKAVRDPQWGPYEPLVDRHAVASFLGIEFRRVLEMTRRMLFPAHPIGGQHSRAVKQN